MIEHSARRVTQEEKLLFSQSPTIITTEYGKVIIIGFYTHNYTGTRLVTSLSLT